MVIEYYGDINWVCGNINWLYSSKLENLFNLEYFDEDRVEGFCLL